MRNHFLVTKITIKTFDGRGISQTLKKRDEDAPELSCEGRDWPKNPYREIDARMAEADIYVFELWRFLIIRTPPPSPSLDDYNEP